MDRPGRRSSRPVRDPLLRLGRQRRPPRGHDGACRSHADTGHSSAARVASSRSTTSHSMISLPYVNPTPWNTPREASEAELAADDRRVDRRRCRTIEHAIFNFHAPPGRVDARHLPDARLARPTRRPRSCRGGQPVLYGAGSTAVRAAIERYQPLLGLHGHIHESQAAATARTHAVRQPGQRVRRRRAARLPHHARRWAGQGLPDDRRLSRPSVPGESGAEGGEGRGSVPSGPSVIVILYRGDSDGDCSSDTRGLRPEVLWPGSRHVPVVGVRLQRPDDGAHLPLDLSLGAGRPPGRAAGLGDPPGDGPGDPDRPVLRLAIDGVPADRRRLRLPEPRASAAASRSRSCSPGSSSGSSNGWRFPAGSSPRSGSHRCSSGSQPRPGTVPRRGLDLVHDRPTGIVVTSVLNALVALLILVSGFRNYIRLQRVMWIAILVVVRDDAARPVPRHPPPKSPASSTRSPPRSAGSPTFTARRDGGRDGRRRRSQPAFSLLATLLIAPIAWTSLQWATY